MTISTRANMFGIAEKALLAMLRQHEGVSVIPSGYSEEVVFVRTLFCLYRTTPTEELLKKYPPLDIGEHRYTVERTRTQWTELEAAQVIARLHPTDSLHELDSGKLVRKLVTGEQVTWYERIYLDVFAPCASLLGNFLMESIEYHSFPFEHRPLRVSLKEGHASAYIMPCRGVVERVW